MSVSDPRGARLALVFGQAVPDGAVAVFAPRAGEDLSFLGPECRVIAGFRPDADWFSARGLPVTTRAEGRYALSVVCLPRTRAAAQDLVAQAIAATDGPVYVDGQKTDGIDAMLRACRARAAVSEPVAKAHGKIFAIHAPDPGDFDDWRAVPQPVEGGMVTLPGVFSADGPDPGSRLLAAVLPERLPPLVADLGAGWGWLAGQALTREGVEELHLIEADHAALECARANLPDPRVRFHWADALGFLPERPFDAVLCNPPFHTARAADPALGVAFVAAAARMLAPRGVLWLVANRHLPYEAALAVAFRQVEEMPGTPAFKLFRAGAPRPAASRGHRP